MIVVVEGVWRMARMYIYREARKDKEETGMESKEAVEGMPVA